MPVATLAPDAVEVDGGADLGLLGGALDGGLPLHVGVPCLLRWPPGFISLGTTVP